ncbi:MAG: PAS domain S-box protein [Pyrinomonadaceae bacterium]
MAVLDVETVNLSESEVRYRRLFESARDGILILDALTRKIIDANPFMVALLGYAREEFLGKELWEIGLLKDEEASKTAFAELQENGYFRYADLTLETKAGARRELEFVSNVYTEGDRQVIQCNIRDITDRRQADFAHQRSETYYRSLIENSADVVSIFDEKVIRRYTSPGVERVLGYTPEELVGKAGLELIHPDDISDLINIFQQLMQNPDSIVSGTFRIKHRNGTWRVMESIASNLLAKPAVAGIVLNSRDITDRRNAEAALQAAEEKYRGIFENAAEGIFQSTPDGRFISANPALARMLGYGTPAELLADRTDIARQHYVDPTERGEFRRSLDASGSIQGTTNEVFRRDGTKIWTRENVRAVRDEAGNLLHYEGTIEDITERQQTEEALRESEERFRSYFELGLIGMAITSPDKGFIEVNDQICAIMGYDRAELLLTSWAALTHPDDLAPDVANFDRVMAGECDGYSMDKRWIRRDGQVVYTTISVKCLRRADGSVHYFVALVQDETERKLAGAAQERLNFEIQNQRERLNKIVANVPGIVWEDWGEFEIPGQRSNFVSNYVETMLGYSVEEWQASPNFWRSVIHPEDRARIEREAEAHFTEGHGGKLEYRWIAKDGKVVWVESNSTVIRDSLGQPIGFRGVTMDITERKRAEQELQSSKNQYQDLIENAHDIIFTVDLKGRFTSINEAGVRMTGYTRDEALGLDLAQTVSPEFLALVWEMMGTKVNGVDNTVYESEIIAKNGFRIPLDVNTSVIREDGKVVGIHGIARDITERKRAERELRKSEERYRELIENAYDIIYTNDLQGNFTSVNQACERITGFTREESLSRNLAEWIAPESLDLAREQLRRRMAGEVVGVSEFNILAKDGRRIAVEVRSSIVYDDGVAVGVQGIARDITERNRAEQELRKSEELYRDLIENAHDIIYSIDLEGNYTSINQAVERITGYTRDEALAMNLDQVVAPDHIATVRQMMAQKMMGDNFTAYESELLAKDGHRIPIEINTSMILENGVPVGVRGIARDVTERRQLEDQLRQAQKMEAIGQLVGGIAHDFNNMLTAINGYSDLTLRKMSDNDPLRRNIEEIKKAGEHSADLTYQLLAFSRQQVLQPKVLSLNQVIADTSKMLQRLIGENVELVAHLDPDTGPVKVDPGQLSQIILNLAVNARDAMPQGGKLTLETSNVSLDDIYARQHAGAELGSYVMLAVSDSGVGIDPAIIGNIFEPIFTTKATGKGTGLGLATVYGIVRQSGGTIRVYSELEHGTVFKIYFPRINDQTEFIESNNGYPALPAGTETILVVEDEDLVRALTRQILDLCGYNVLEARNGNEALAVCETYAGPIELLLTDVVMPIMGGRELAERVALLLPTMSVLFTSGYTDDAIVHHGVIEASANFIQKPFTTDDLAHKVRGILDARKLN